MPSNSLDEQVTKYLTDVHSIEEQALAQMRLAPRVAGDGELKRIFAEHLKETEEHERLVREQLERRGAKPSAVKDVAGRVGGWGMILFARVNPDTPGKLAMHAFSYEHMELAAYELLRRVAERAGDEPVRAMAERIGAQERAMADRIGELWDRAVEASLREKGAEDIDRTS
jgi:ferritin-like metal-binding protein YciE